MAGCWPHNSRAMANDRDDPQDEASPSLRLHKRELPADYVRTPLSRREKWMLLKLQEQYDMPFTQIIRNMIREEFERTFGALPLPVFDGLGATATPTQGGSER